jgi:threonine dehydrogenase-like Zn-dependent dehydrogenase
MKALIFDGKIRIEKNVPIPKRKPFEVLIRVLKAGICQTDLEIIKGYLHFQGILGHEFVGIIEESSNQELLGKRIVGEINLACGKCIYCQKEMPSHCNARSVLGIKDKNGCFAEYITLPVNNIHVIPDSIANDEAIFVEPLAAALQILTQVHIRPRDDVIILGDGRLGHLCTQVMSLTGAQVQTVGKHLGKLKILKKRGIKTFRFDEVSQNRADFVIECTGSPAGFNAALNLVHPRGTIVLKSNYEVKPPIDLAPIVIDEITIIGSRCGPFPPAIRLLENKVIDVLSLISQRFPLDKALEAIKAAHQKENLKIILDISN